MTKIFLLLVAYTTPDGELHLDWQKTVDHCPSQEEAVVIMEPLKETGYMKQWAYFCQEVYEVTPYNHPTAPGGELQGKAS